MQGDSCCGRTKKPKLQGASGAKMHLRWNQKTSTDPQMVKCSHSAADEGLAERWANYKSQHYCNYMEPICLDGLKAQPPFAAVKCTAQSSLKTYCPHIWMWCSTTDVPAVPSKYWLNQSTVNQQEKKQKNKAHTHTHTHQNSHTYIIRWGIYIISLKSIRI